MLLQLPLFAVGLGLLYLGAEWLVRGAASLALQYGIRRLVVGITVVALGTSMPEFVVNVVAALSHEDGLALGNIVGSNICNIALILGVSALILPLVVSPGTLGKEYTIMMAAMGAFYVMALDGVISQLDGLILITGLIAFLTFLGEARDTAALLRFLGAPPAALDRPEEDRALLLAPQALGQLAARGDRVALESLLDMTANGSRGGVLLQAASGGGNQQALRDDLVEMALRGLAYSGAVEARERIQWVAKGHVRPVRTRSMVRPAEQALTLFDELYSSWPVGQADSGVDGSGATAEAAGTGSLDTQTRVHDAGITSANHVQVTDPLTDARLDHILDLANQRAGAGDFLEDVACCTTMTRAGTVQTFGTSVDGLDIIDDSTEMSTVMNHPVARFKVVRAINYCGGPGTNIIVCAWRPGDGSAVVRRTNDGSEAVLWIHEYGHNVGLPHNTIGSTYLMYGIDYGTNSGLTQSECDTYHSPSSSAGMSMQDVGACSDHGQRRRRRGRRR